MSNSRLGRTVAAAITGVPVLLSVLCVAWNHQASLSLGQQGIVVAGLQAKLREAEGKTTEAPRADFAEHLSVDVSIDPVVRELRRTTDLGVVFVSVSASTRDATERAIGRTDVSLALRGSYPQLKTVLGDVLNRFPNLILRRLALRRLASPTEVEAQVELAMVSRPVLPSVASDTTRFIR